MKRFFFFLVITSLIFLENQDIKGQIFLIGTDPASVKWNQVRSPNFRVIFPDALGTKGQYIANALEYNYLHGCNTLNTLAVKTPVIVHPYTTVPSSVTYIAPRRMEFFTTPPQDIYPQDWTDQLVIHEFRHAVQYSALNKGFTKGLTCLLGEQAALGIFGLYLPMWFIEGDATAIETALHLTGRGRTPSFEMRLRAQIVEKGIYPYEKACYGSYGDFVPGKYEIGYQIVGWSRLLYGKDLWAKVMSSVGRKPYTLTAFSSPLKKETGLNKYGIYDTVTNILERKWVEDDKSHHAINTVLIPARKNKFYTNYNLPVIFRDSLIIAVRSSPDILPGVVLLDRRGSERELFKLGANYYSETLSSRDSVIFWSELVTDPRWFLRDYRVIKKYSFNTGEVSQLTHRSRYFAPAISHNGRQLAVVEADPYNMYSLVVLDPETGLIKKKITSPDNLLFIHPSWSANDSLIVSVVFGKNGNSLGITDPETGITRILMPFSFFEMKSPVFFGDMILYTASYNGKDNIYAFDMLTAKVYQVTSARFGSTNVTCNPKRNEIIYSDYSADGYRIVTAPLNVSGWKEICVPEKSSFELAERLTEQEGFIFNTDSVPHEKYEEKHFSKILNKINIHSWAPIGVDIQNISIAPGITLFSQNLLETTVISSGYQYNRNERTSRVFMNISDESLYPAVGLNIDYGNRRDTGLYTLNETIPEKWNEFNITPGLRLPLYWTKGPWIRKLKAGIGLNLKFLSMSEGVPVSFEDERILAPAYSFLLHNEIKTSYRDLFPAWSQEVSFDFSNTPFGENYNSIVSCHAEFLVPGFLKHHSLKLYSGYQRKISETYPFQDLIFLPRGYTDISLKEIISLSAVYSMPLFYPDWRIKSIAYLKRFKGSLFFDYAKGIDISDQSVFSSAGADLTCDLNLFNLLIPIDAGVRTLYAFNSKSIGFEFLFSLNFGAMY